MYPQNKHNILKNKVKLKPKVLVVLMGMVLFTTSCSSDNKPIKVKNTIDDPVKVTVKGINKDVVLNNVNAYIASLPTISKKRARLYDSEIKENIQTVRLQSEMQRLEPKPVLTKLDAASLSAFSKGQ